MKCPGESQYSTLFTQRLLHKCDVRRTVTLQPVAPPRTGSAANTRLQQLCRNPSLIEHAQNWGRSEQLRVHCPGSQCTLKTQFQRRVDLYAERLWSTYFIKPGTSLARYRAICRQHLLAQTLMTLPLLAALNAYFPKPNSSTESTLVSSHDLHSNSWRSLLPKAVNITSPKA